MLLRPLPSTRPRGARRPSIRQDSTALKWTKRIGGLIALMAAVSMLNPVLVYHTKRYNPVDFNGYYEYSGVIGIHTRFSDGTLSFGQISRISDDLNLHFVITTDVNTTKPMEQSLDSRFGMTLMIPAVEISANNGRDKFLVIGDSTPILPGRGVTLDSALAYAEQKGSLVILDSASNPEKYLHAGSGGRPLFDGMELYNFGRSWRRMFTVTQINKVFGAYMIHPFNRYSLNYVIHYPERRMKEFERLSETDRIVGIGATGSGFGSFPSYQDAMNLIRTIIVSRTPYTAHYAHDRALTLSALKRGHSYVAFPGFESARGFFFTASSGDSAVMMGDSLALDGSANIGITLPDSSGVQTRVFRNGDLLHTYDDRGTIDLTVHSPGRYRVEVFQKRTTIPFLARSYPWILSNPIFIYQK